MPTKIHYGPGEFLSLKRGERGERGDLKTVAVAAQSLDNQWVPRSLLGEMMRKQKTLRDVSRRRDKAVRNEYIRALLNGEQVVINRAFLYNNPVVYSDFLPKSPDLAAFKELVARGVIVQYLFRETTPIDQPAFAVGDGFDAWLQVAKETVPSCIRFSWQEDPNKELTRQWLSRRFTEFVALMSVMDEVTLAQDLGKIRKDALPAFRQRLIQAGRWLLDQREAGKEDVTREDFYRQFVCVDGTAPADGYYDLNKPFSAELKTLVDLKYSLNLPDGLGILGMTPLDSPPRTVLQEWRDEQQKQQEISADTLLNLLRNTAFDLIQQVLVPGVHQLALRHVLAIRDSHEWELYIEAMKQLIHQPLAFAAYAPEVYRKYQSLAGVVRKQRTDLAEGKLQSWRPVVELAFEVAGAGLSVAFTPAGLQPELWGKISSKIVDGVAPIVGRLVIHGAAAARARAGDLGFNLAFLRGRLSNAIEQWDAFTRQVSEIPGYEKARERLDIGQVATLDQPAEEPFQYA